MPKRESEEVRKSLPPGVKLVRTLRGHTGRIGHMAWSPDGRLLASPSGDRTIRLWDAETGKLLRTFEGHEDAVLTVAFDPVGRTLASWSDDKTVKLWGLSSPFETGPSAALKAGAASSKILRSLKGQKEAVCSVAFDPAGKTLASGGFDGTVILWEAASGRILRFLKGHKGWILDVEFDPAGGILASGSEDGTVKLWESASGKLLLTLESHGRLVHSVAFDPTGRILASGGLDGAVKLWDLLASLKTGAASGKLLRTLEGHTDAITSVAFLYDGRLIASKGLDDTIRLWNRDAGVCVSTIPEPNSGYLLASIAFHPRLPLLATVGSDPGVPRAERGRVIHIWELDLAVLLAQPAAPTVTYTSAKVVLVGESNVGKSYLAHRIAMGSPPEEGTIKTTHGMVFWPLEPERLSAAAKAPPGQRRDVVLWDMGGQEEYRLIHQLFLHDTTVALVLLDPTRGATAFKEVETWNKYLDKQLRGRAAVKLLVGAKLDQPSDTIDQKGLERLCRECDFAGFYESSALTGRGLPELCEAVAKAIDWDGLGLTSRPELFQRIRDAIEARRKRGEVVLSYSDVHEAVGYKDPRGRKSAIHAVTEQLAAQGVVARSQMTKGKPVLVLQVQEIERYAGSLIVAARNNPRGVPALELRAITQPDFPLPGIADKGRLPRGQEKPVLECTVQLMLEHGLCFQHEGLLVFPTLFAPAPEAADTKLPHTVSLYYDFAGAIDNIYASLVASLVLARDFGRVRLWSERAEFEMKDGGLCGLRKVARPGGFAHVDVYFEVDTPERRRKEFISFVEDHLARNGVDIREHVAITCACGHQLAEETLRQRIARGDKDVVCPVCETRHSLAEGAAEARERDPEITQRTWALRTMIEELREKITRQAVQVLERAAGAKPATRPMRLLHLSDLHFTAATPVEARLRWLLDDIKLETGLGFQEVDYLVPVAKIGKPCRFSAPYQFCA